MNGAILGDMAYHTWKFDKPGFNKYLITDKSDISDASLTVMASYQTIFDTQSDDDPKVFAGYLKVLMEECQDRKNIHFSKHLTEWLNGSTWQPYGSNGDNALLRAIPAAWAEENLLLCIYHSNSLVNLTHNSKDALSASETLVRVIFQLRHGMTTHDVFQKNPLLQQMVQFDLKNHSAMKTLSIAWESLISGYDFCSVVHHVCQTGYSPTCAAVAGAMAQAMYGCAAEFQLIDPETGFCEDTPLDVGDVLPPFELLKGLWWDMSAVAKEKKTFIGKNECRASIMKQKWTSLPAIEYPLMSEKDMKALMRSFSPDWDNRYSFYYDNGWHYIYRSGILLNRFKVIRATPKKYRIIDMQKTPFEADNMVALNEAFYSLYKISGRKVFRQIPLVLLSNLE